MNAVWGSVVGSLVVALITGAFVLVGRRADAKASAEVADKNREATERIEERKVDREEFDSITRELRAALLRVTTELEAERDRRAESDRATAEAKQRAVRAEQRQREAEKAGAAATRNLTRRVEQLEQLMRAEGMSVPPPLH